MSKTNVKGFGDYLNLVLKLMKTLVKIFWVFLMHCFNKLLKFSNSRLPLCYQKKHLQWLGSRLTRESAPVLCLLLRGYLGLRKVGNWDRISTESWLLKTPKFVYTVDMDVEKLLDFEPRLWDFISELEPKVGLVEHIPVEKAVGDLFSLLHNCKKDLEDAGAGGADSNCNIPSHKPKVAVVGSGPAGLFATLVLGELGADVTLIERGQPVEQRGRDIGALVVRRIIQSESNFCFGEVPGVTESS
ncbi:hypothetical protein BVRB_8g191520 isoform B [Beta vulgaris subsp. vulgaris]|nr:hypothetical protein BVRB_8g191520 isoform B [Beta vulgaris subsp. vulgaris]